MDTTQIMTFGDVRRSIISTIEAVKSGALDGTKGMAVAALFKVLNDNVQVEINAAKMALATEGKAHSFGRIVGMGKRIIGPDGSGGDEGVTV